jgi:hypothetical protein
MEEQEAVREPIMPVNIWSHLCDYATVDHGSRKATIVGEFDNIAVKTLPAHHPFMAVATKWAVQDHEQFAQQVRIVSPSGQTVAESPAQTVTAHVAPENREGTHTHINYFIGATFPEAGTYLVQIMIDGHVDHAIQLHLTQTGG